MIYLDYSATTPVSSEVLDSFNKSCTEFLGNANSLHTLGVNCKNIVDQATNQIASILKVKSSEIIYTSGSSESNNTAIKGICLKYQNRGKHIITTRFEHSSIYGPISYLQKQGFEVDFVESNDDGTVNLDNLKSLLRDDTILVCINAINSEIGIIQPINEIGEILKDYPKCFYHVDLTQAIGKIDIDFTNIDLAAFSAHKIFGIKGIGVLYKKESIVIDPLIHGGKSTTVYRSGTPMHPLIVSISKALRLIYEDKEKRYNYVKELNEYLKEKISNYENVYINSNDKCLPHILNISVVGVKPETFLHALEKYEVYISTQTACSSEKAISQSVLALTKSEDRAKSSLRISLSHVTTKEELDKFVEIFDKCYHELTLK